MRTRPLILIADDSEFALNTVRRAYRCKYDFVLARDGNEAILEAKIHHPDLILMDILMPGLDGIEATRQIKADHNLCMIPAIIVTSLSDHQTELACLNAGADDFVPKTINCEILQIKIDRLFLS